jgi:AcrR family transcriptional regulator
MSPRPKNPPPDRRAEILAAALDAFAAKGYTAATNAEIARAAGVTAAALYYYFPSKADLFRAAVSERKEHLMPTVAGLKDQLFDLPPDLVLPQLIMHFKQFLLEERTQRLLRIVLAEGPRNPEIVQIWSEQAVGPGMQLLTAYLQHQVELGNLRPIDPPVMLLLLQGPLIATVVLKDLVGVPELAEVQLESVMQTALQLILPALQTKKE